MSGRLINTWQTMVMTDDNDREDGDASTWGCSSHRPSRRRQGPKYLSVWIFPLTIPKSLLRQTTTLPHTAQLQSPTWCCFFVYSNPEACSLAASEGSSQDMDLSRFSSVVANSAEIEARSWSWSLSSPHTAPLQMFSTLLFRHFSSYNFVIIPSSFSHYPSIYFLALVLCIVIKVWG